MRSLNDCTNTNMIYIMEDPARDKSKTDVLFFATKIGTIEIVRVLVQLTLAKDNAPSKIRDKITATFTAMVRDVSPVTFNEIGVVDYRIFIGPYCNVELGDKHIIPEQSIVYANDHCLLFLQSNSIASKFELSIDVICNPMATEAAINSLVTKAETFGNAALVNQLKSRNIWNKRQALGADDAMEIDEGSQQSNSASFLVRALNKIDCVDKKIDYISKKIDELRGERTKVLRKNETDQDDADKALLADFLEMVAEKKEMFTEKK
ncbi:hypothetical protein HDU84_001304, partial [Entophlyctis sp. JEL0112]